MHLRDSAAAQAEQALLHGEAAPTVMEHLWSAQLWFESFQNWQSEFLPTAVVVVLSIFLRFRGSPEPKPVAAPHSETGPDTPVVGGGPGGNERRPLSRLSLIRFPADAHPSRARNLCKAGRLASISQSRIR